MMSTVTVLSPHQDDAALSLGTTIRSITHAKHRVLIINCFTCSTYAPYVTAPSAAEVSRIRCQEDEEFAARLGGGVKFVNLGLLDAPLRLGLPVHRVRRRHWSGGDTRKDTRTVVETLQPVAEGVVLAPLGLGGHVDHVVARDAGIELARRNHSVAFYEDLPYAAEARICCIARAVNSLAKKMRTALRPAMIADAVAGNKRSLIEAYCSQLAFRQIQSVVEYGDRERFWTTAAAAEAFPIEIEYGTRTASGRVAFRALECAVHRGRDRIGALARRAVSLAR